MVQNITNEVIMLHYQVFLLQNPPPQDIPYTTVNSQNLSLESVSSYSLDSLSIMPLLQRKLNNFTCIITPDSNNLLPPPFLPTTSTYLYTNIPSNIRRYFGLSTVSSSLTSTGFSTYVFEETELSMYGPINIINADFTPGMYDLLIQNFINYGVPMCTYKHNFNPDPQCQISYGFDDPWYGPYKNRSIPASFSFVDSYTPTITWFILQSPKIPGFSPDNRINPPPIPTVSNIPLYVSPFWKSLTLNTDFATIYTALYTSSNFPVYGSVSNLSNLQINTLILYSSTMSDCYLVPWIKKNCPPFHIFITSAGFIPTPYMGEQYISNGPLFLFADNPVPNPPISPLPFNYRSRSIAYSPQLQQYIVLQGNIIRTYFQYRNSSDVNFQFANISYNLSNISSLTQSNLLVDHLGNIFISGNFNNSAYTIGYIAVSSLSNPASPNISCNFLSFSVGISSLISPSCMMITSLHQTKDTAPAKNKLYVGIGQPSITSNSSNLWIFITPSETSHLTPLPGITIPPASSSQLQPILAGNPTPYFNTQDYYVISIVETFKMYDPSRNTSYFQYAVLSTTGTNYGLTFITEPFGNSYTTTTPNFYNAKQYTTQVYSMEYSPTISFFVIAYSNGTNIVIDLYNCSISSTQADNSISNPTFIAAITTILPLPTTNCVLKYVGKQLLISIDNVVYNLKDITYEGTTPISLIFQPLYTDTNGNSMLEMF